MDTGERWHTTAEIAAMLRLAPRTISEAIRRGDLRGVKISDAAGWRVRDADLQAWLDSRANKPREGASDHDER